MSTLHLNNLNQANLSQANLSEAEWDLIADEVLGELDAADESALDRVDLATHARAREALEQTAGALAAALAEEHGAALSKIVVERVQQRCAMMAGASDSGRTRREGPSVIGRIGPWMIAAAACVVAAVSVWPTGAVSPRTQLAMLRANASDTQVASWSDWSLEGQPPKVAGVAGEVVWSDTKQSGVLHFEGLPPCEAGKRYQLWIVDAERGFEQRISGAIFDGAPGELYVPVKPKIPVHKAAAFAVTIERADGTWVSDMSQRVVIAMVK